MTDDRFRKPAADWTDDELRVGIGEVLRRRDELAAAGNASEAAGLHAVLIVLVEERERRVKLGRQVGDDMAEAAGVQAFDISDLLRLDDTN